MKTANITAFLVFSLFFMGNHTTAAEFPSFLNEKYCTDIKLDFMTNSIRSLQLYKEKQLATRHRGGMNNIRNFLTQRQDWLKECDEYLSATSNRRLFKDDKTSDQIFYALESVSAELDALIRGVSYTANAGGATGDLAAEKFDNLFKLVDDHQTLMLMRGQVVYR